MLGQLGFDKPFPLSHHSSLTLGILSLDDLNLKVLETSGESQTERDHAKRLINLLSLGRHWILSVLLLSNSVVNEALPIFLDSILGGGYVGFILVRIAHFSFSLSLPFSFPQLLSSCLESAFSAIPPF